MPSSSLAFCWFCELSFLCSREMYKTMMGKNDVTKKSTIAMSILSVNALMVNSFAYSVTCGTKSMTRVEKRMKTSCAPESV